MMKSMTAFGRASAVCGGKEIVIEIKSVNSRYFDCTAHLPRTYLYLEERIKSFVQKNAISRGKVEIFVNVNILSHNDISFAIDEGYAANYIDALRQLRDRFGLTDDISIMTVARNSDIFTVQKPQADDEADWQMLLPILTEAAASHTAMRELEGKRLTEDLLAKREGLITMIDRIDELAPRAEQVYRERLERKLRQTLEDHALSDHFDEARILTECAIFSDKTAIDEEIVRFRSHLTAFRDILNSGEAAGKKIDFLLQEMNREINTIGSKASDNEITALVVDTKCELEKIREQIQNLE